MHKAITILVLLFFIIGQAKQAPVIKKHIIGCRNERAGFFSEFLGVLNHLEWCEEHQRTPIVVWDDHCSYYQPGGYNGAFNAWNYYFQPVSNLSYKKGELIWRKYEAPDGFGIPPMNVSQHKRTLEYRHWANALIDKYIKVVPSIKNKVDDFYEKYMAGKYTIGIHLRGTDKYTEVAPVSMEKIIDAANQHAQLYPGCQFFVATDEQWLLERAKELLKGPVLYTDAYRSIDGNPIHKQNLGIYSKAKMGEEILIDALLLARCDYFIHTCSNVSCTVLFFNPDLPHTVLT